MTRSKATFQPTVRPDWAGAMDYISESEQSQIFQAILMFPSIDLPNSAFWNKTIKPDLEQQYKTFIESCEKKSIGIRKRWETEKSIDMNTDVIDNYTNVIDKDSPLKNKNKIQEQENREYIPSLSTTHANTFTPPTEQEVLDYAADQNQFASAGGFACPPEIAQAFYDYYSSTGWTLSNDARTPILNWKPKLRQWATNPKYKKPEQETVDINDPNNFLI